MICLACASENDARSDACRSCGSPNLARKRPPSAEIIPTIRSDDDRIAAAEARLAALAQQIAAVETERAAIVAALALVRGLPVGMVANAAIESNAAARLALLEIGDLRVTLGGRYGSEVERRAPPSIDDRQFRRRLEFQRPQPREIVRSELAARVFAEFAAGAAVVQIVGGPGAGTTTFLDLVAGRARAHGFTDGAIRISDARGPVGDVAQRLIGRFFDFEQSRRLPSSEIAHVFRGITALVLLDRAHLTVEEQTALSNEFPNLKFAIAEAAVDPRRPTVTLAPLDDDAALIMLEAAYGRPISGEQRRAALAMCPPAGRHPGRTRLIGIAAAELAQSFSTLHATLGTGDAAIGALIASLSAAERLILGILDLIRIPLSAPQIAAIGGGPPPATALDRLVECELVRVCGPLYSLARDVAPLVPQPVDADLLFERAVAVLCATLETWNPESTLDDQVYPAEPLAEVVFERSHWSAVPLLGIRLAQASARLGVFGAWGRLLNFLSAAAKCCDDSHARVTIRHESGVRALVLGDRHKALQCLRSAVADREAAGDAAGAAVSRAALALAETPRATANAPVRRRRIASEPPREAAVAALPAVAIGPATPVIPVAAAAVSAVSPHARIADSTPPARQRPPVDSGRLLVALALAVFIVAIAVGWMWARPTQSASAAIPVSQGASPAAVTPRPLAIEDFSVSPQRVPAGGSTRLCYAVTGADLLRIVPNIGPLPRLHSCRTIAAGQARHATFSLVAFGEAGSVAVRRLQLDVVAKLHAVPTLAATPKPVPPIVATTIHVPSAVVARVAPRARDAIYQFDVSPHVVARGGLASLCVGIGRYARATVTTIGELPPGITRCYRVAPATTTVYRLHVTLDRSVDVETATVAVLESPARHDAPRREASRAQQR